MTATPIIIDFNANSLLKSSLLHLLWVLRVSFKLSTLNQSNHSIFNIEDL